MRVHVVGLPHTQTTREYDWCAYTAKVRKLGKMLHARGHEMLLYAGEENEAVCAEHVPIVTRDEQRAWFPDWNPTTQPWPGTWNKTDPWWRTMNGRAIAAISERIEPYDVVGLIQGSPFEPLRRMFYPDHIVCEWGVGYEGIMPDLHGHAFESYAWMHHVYGLEKRRHGRAFDTVIPNSFDPDELDFSAEHDGYLLYLGRMIDAKGLAVVDELAKRHHVITAGQGDRRVPGAEHRGLVLGDEKAKLLSRAKAVLVPTSYIEPFGGVAVEAMMSGAPVITTDYGAFTETVEHGVTGFRCSVLRDFLEAVERVDDLDRLNVASTARARYSLDAISGQYDRWLERLQLLHRDGWYAE